MNPGPAAAPRISSCCACWPCSCSLQKPDAKDSGGRSGRVGEGFRAREPRLDRLPERNGLADLEHQGTGAVGVLIDDLGRDLMTEGCLVRP